MRRLGGTDAAFLYGETPAWHMHVSALMIVDPSTSGGEFGFERLKELVLERLPAAPQFRWKYVEVPFGLDRPLWVEDPDFDIDFHLRHVAVRAPGGPHELGELVGRLVSYKLDRSRPLWEMWMIEGVEGGRVALVTKIHHAIIDGVSGAGLADILLDLTPEPRPAPTATRESLHQDRIPGSGELLVRGATSAIVDTPLRLARLARQSLMQGLTMMSFARRENRPATMLDSGPRTSLNGTFTPHRRFASASLPLDRVKALRKQFDVKLNDVVLALCSSALRRYLLKIHDLPDAPLLAQCPVSLRTDGDRDAVGNRVGAMVVSLATDVSDPALRLLAIHESTRGAKEMQQALSVHRIQSLTETTPPGLIALAARMYTSMGLGNVLPSFNVVISNVPGPPVPLYLAGARAEKLYPMGPLLLGMGLNITVISFVDSLDIGLLCCPELVPDPDYIAEGFLPALEELEVAAARFGS